jgi:hypothetical protein
MKVQSLRLGRAGVGIAAVLSVLGVGCAGDPSSDGASRGDADDSAPLSSANLVAEAQGDGYTLWYSEPEPGVLIEDEKGTGLARHFANEHDLDMVQRYELVAGKKAPPSLLAAAARAGVATHEDEPVPERRPDSNNKSAGTFVSEQWFRDNYCVKTDRFYMKTLWNDPDTWEDRVEYMKAGAYVISGCADYWVSYAGSGSAFYQLTHSTYGGKRATSTINRAVLSELNNLGRCGTASALLHCINYHF